MKFQPCWLIQESSLSPGGNTHEKGWCKEVMNQEESFSLSWKTALDSVGTFLCLQITATQRCQETTERQQSHVKAVIFYEIIVSTL